MGLMGTVSLSFCWRKKTKNKCIGGWMSTYICGVAGPLVADHLTLETKVVVSIFLFILCVRVHYYVDLIACACVEDGIRTE